jgi:hypothetical protein
MTKRRKNSDKEDKEKLTEWKIWEQKKLHAGATLSCSNNNNNNSLSYSAL